MAGTRGDAMSHEVPRCYVQGARKTRSTAEGTRKRQGSGAWQHGDTVAHELWPALPGTVPRGHVFLE